VDLVQLVLLVQSVLLAPVVALLAQRERQAQAAPPEALLVLLEPQGRAVLLAHKGQEDTKEMLAQLGRLVAQAERLDQQGQLDLEYQKGPNSINFMFVLMGLLRQLIFYTYHNVNSR
jgi:competence protein ComGC